MMQLFGCIFITICVILVIVLHLELKIKENEYVKNLYEENKQNDIIEKKTQENIYKNTLIDYIKNTKDLSILNDDLKENLNPDTSFVNPNLSMRNARSDFIVEPLDFNTFNKNKNNMANQFEKTILKKIK
jgi:hypothetical protein